MQDGRHAAALRAGRRARPAVEPPAGRHPGRQRCGGRDVVRRDAGAGHRERQVVAGPADTGLDRGRRGCGDRGRHDPANLADAGDHPLRAVHRRTVDARGHRLTGPGRVGATARAARSRPGHLSTGPPTSCGMPSPAGGACAARRPSPCCPTPGSRPRGRPPTTCSGTPRRSASPASARTRARSRRSCCSTTSHPGSSGSSAVRRSPSWHCGTSAATVPRRSRTSPAGPGSPWPTAALPWPTTTAGSSRRPMRAPRCS